MSKIEFHEAGLRYFLDTAIERHSIYLKRQKGQPKPWSKDPIFQQFFFCNVFRQYDKVSKWIIENIVPYKRWDMLLLYRFISTMEIFELIENYEIEYDDFNRIHTMLEQMYDDGKRIFNGCFIRNPCISTGYTSPHNVPFHLIKELKGNDFDPSLFTRLESVVSYMKQFIGIGGFMAYEYACDFAYADFFNPKDIHTWANKGPGATRGMSLVLYGYSDKKIGQKKWLEAALQLYPLLKGRFNQAFPDEEITMREVEHWLCELQKYVKYKDVLEKGRQVKFRRYYGI